MVESIREDFLLKNFLGEVGLAEIKQVKNKKKEK